MIMKRTQTREKIIEAFMPKITEELISSEVCEKSGYTHEPVYRHLRELTKNKILIHKKKGRTHLFKLNLENEEVRKLIENYNLKRKQQFLESCPEFKPLLKDLVEGIKSNIGPHFLSIILFGSVARGKTTKKSDIDILIIISAEEIKRREKLSDDIYRVCSTLEYKYDRPFSPIIVSLGGFGKMLEEKKDFTKNLVKDGIVLYGEEIFYRELLSTIRGFEWIE